MWYPSSLSCPEQTADKHRTPAVGPEVYQQQHPTEGEPPLPVLSWDPRGDGQDSESQGHLRWDVIPRTCSNPQRVPPHPAIPARVGDRQHPSRAAVSFPQDVPGQTDVATPQGDSRFPLPSCPRMEGTGVSPSTCCPRMERTAPYGDIPIPQDVPGWRGEQVPLPGPSQGGVAAPHRHPVCPPALTRSRGQDTSGSRGRRRGSGAA